MTAKCCQAASTVQMVRYHKKTLRRTQSMKVSRGPATGTQVLLIDPAERE
jgi:hypothetical protein